MKKVDVRRIIKEEIQKVLKESNISAGSYVLIEPTGKGLQQSYPATNWLKNEMKVKLLDDAPNRGTLDVLDVELPDGSQESIYDFNIKENVLFKQKLTEMWKSRLQKNYDDDYDQFVQYDEIYGIAKRLGFESPEEAWEANPIIQGSTDPKDLKVVETTDDFGEDDKQFNMSFSFTANNTSQVKMTFVKIKRTDEVWKNINKIADWIENQGFRDADEAFYWIENMYNADKIQSGEAVVLHWSKRNWILAAKDDSFIGESSFPRADSYREKHEPIDKRRINKFIKAVRKALKKHNMIINTGLDDFDKLNDAEFEQVKADAEKNGWEFVQFEDNYQTTSYKMKKMTRMNEFITSGNELEILDNAAKDINSNFFHNRASYNPLLYQMLVRDNKDDVLKILDTKTEVKERGKGFTAKADEATEYYELPEYNVSISFAQYRVSRGTTIQFLNFNGELPEKKGMYN